MDMLEERGIIGPPTQGSQPREVIDYGEGEEINNKFSPQRRRAEEDLLHRS